jgi:hypothetical protein
LLPAKRQTEIRLSQMLTRMKQRRKSLTRHAPQCQLALLHRTRLARHPLRIHRRLLHRTSHMLW